MCHFNFHHLKLCHKEMKKKVKTWVRNVFNKAWKKYSFFFFLIKDDTGKVLDLLNAVVKKVAEPLSIQLSDLCSPRVLRTGTPCPAPLLHSQNPCALFWNWCPNPPQSNLKTHTLLSSWYQNPCTPLPLALLSEPCAPSLFSHRVFPWVLTWLVTPLLLDLWATWCHAACPPTSPPRSRGRKQKLEGGRGACSPWWQQQGSESGACTGWTSRNTELIP